MFASKNVPFLETGTFDLTDQERERQILKKDHSDGESILCYFCSLFP